MHRQHERFLQIHEEDDFVRDYMEAIGHHEFGKGLKLVNFGGWLQDSPPDPGDLEFWLRYWTAAYQFILGHADESTVLVPYARLTKEPEQSLSQLVDAVRLSDEHLAPLAGKLHPPRTHSVDQGKLPSSVLQKADDINAHLDERAVV